jgi:hypothetical protein
MLISLRLTQITGVHVQERVSEWKHRLRATRQQVQPRMIGIVNICLRSISLEIDAESGDL